MPGEADAPAIAAYYARNESAFARWGEARSHDAAVHASELAFAARRSSRTEAMFTSFLRTDEAQTTIVGLVFLSAMSFARAPTATLGYNVDAAYEGHGYASEAVACVLAYAAREFGIRHVLAYYACENIRSGALLARLGFATVGETYVVPHHGRFDEPHLIASLALAQPAVAHTAQPQRGGVTG